MMEPLIAFFLWNLGAAVSAGEFAAWAHGDDAGKSLSCRQFGVSVAVVVIAWPFFAAANIVSTFRKWSVK